MIKLNSFICGDCMDYLPQFPDDYFDLAIVDPQYGIGEDGGKDRGSYATQKNGDKVFVPSGDYIKTGRDNRPTGPEYFDELFRVSKEQIIWGANYFRLPPGGAIVWDKCNDGSDQSGAEIAFNSLTKRVDVFRFMWRGMFQGKSILEGTIQQGNKALNEKRIHPNQKPVVLYDWLLARYAKPGMRILDTHVGSASSLIACHKAGINYIGFEENRHYYDLANKRLQEHKSQITLFDLGMERK